MPIFTKHRHIFTTPSGKRIVSDEEILESDGTQFHTVYEITELENGETEVINHRSSSDAYGEGHTHTIGGITSGTPIIGGPQPGDIVHPTKLTPEESKAAQ